MKPNENEYASFYQNYVNNCLEEDIITNLTINREDTLALLKSISEEKANYAYADGKWTIKELVQHIIDTERVFTYRAMCIARGETTALPGFNENLYAANSLANSRSLDSLIKEFDSVRIATLDLFNSFNKETLTKIGNANGSITSVRAIGFITAGHGMHHMAILRERYL